LAILATLIGNQGAKRESAGDGAMCEPR
jgi:hypothetical protein